MNDTAWLNWFRSWSLQHPLRNPPDLLQSNYTEKVMSRIQTQPERLPFPHLERFLKPRFSFALGAVAASLLLVLFLHRTPTFNSTVDIEQTLDLLEQAGPKDLTVGEESLSDQDLLEELQQLDETELAVS